MTPQEYLREYRARLGAVMLGGGPEAFFHWLAWLTVDPREQVVTFGASK